MPSAGSSQQSREQLLERIRMLESSNHRGWLSLSRWRDARCFCCGSAELKALQYPYLRDPAFARLEVLGCVRCGVSWVPELPFSLDAYYRKQHAVAGRQDGSDSAAAYFRRLEDDPRMAKYVRRARRHASYLTHFFPRSATVLDYGSGRGYFLSLVKAQCSSALAVEPDSYSHKFLRDLGVQAWRESPETIGPVDFVRSSHRLEHLLSGDLAPTLRRLHSLLSDDGILCAEVPCGTILRHLLVSRHAPHTIFFSPEALARSLEDAGFATVCIGSSGRRAAPLLSHPAYQPERFREIDGMGPLVALASKRADDTRLLEFSRYRPRPSAPAKPEATGDRSASKSAWRKARRIARSARRVVESAPLRGARLRVGWNGWGLDDDGAGT